LTFDSHRHTKSPAHDARRLAKVMEHDDQPDHNQADWSKVMATSIITTNSPKIDTTESIAGLIFEPLGNGLESRGTLAEWLTSARNEYANIGICLTILGHDQDKLYSLLSDSVGGDDVPDCWWEMIEMFGRRKSWHEASAEMYTAAETRLLVVMERLAKEGRVN
jgi:hypothetical protein